MSVPPASYKRHRFPRELIAHAVWLYFRFPLSFRLIEEMLLERGIVVSYETVRRWSQKFGAPFARRLRRKRASARDIWHLDEVRIVIHGQPHWLWRAVDQDGYILDEILQTRRNTKAARRLLTRQRKKQGREFTSAVAKARTCHAKVSITGRLSALRMRLLHHINYMVS